MAINLHILLAANENKTQKCTKREKKKKEEDEKRGKNKKWMMNKK